MNTLSDTCLLLWIYIQLSNVIALIADVILQTNNMYTITELARFHIWLAVIIILFEFIGVTLLAVHIFIV